MLKLKSKLNWGRNLIQSTKATQFLTNQSSEEYKRINQKKRRKEEVMEIFGRYGLTWPYPGEPVFTKSFGSLDAGQFYPFVHSLRRTSLSRALTFSRLFPPHSPYLLTTSPSTIMEYHSVPPEERARDEDGNLLPWGYVYKEYVWWDL